jgi:hypothetical protein
MHGCALGEPWFLLAEPIRKSIFGRRELAKTPSAKPLGVSNCRATLSGSSDNHRPMKLLDVLINLFYRTLIYRDRARLRCRAFCCYRFSLFQIGDDMAKKTSKRREWTRTDVRELKTLAREKTPARKIARTLKRTEGATRQKAFSLGVSLDSRA